MAAESQIDTARERTPSSIESTPSPEPDLGREASQEAAPPQKRKGGRKPVYTMLCSRHCRPFTNANFCRSMLLLKNENNEIDKHRRLFENDDPNTLNSLRLLSNKMKTHSLHYNRAIALLRTNVLCSVTRTPCWNGSCLKEVIHLVARAARFKTHAKMLQALMCKQSSR